MFLFHLVGGIGLILTVVEVFSKNEFIYIYL